MQSIGKGGMGEVFLAYDTTCGRRIALKQIRPDLTEHKQLYKRFIKEARITSQLTHPAIIPIYEIHHDNKQTFYTMPYVEGQTLKQILKIARQHERKGEKLDHLTGSIPALLRIFLSICQAIAYSHARGVLHRDLKPENIIVGQYGQIVILDWGLAIMSKKKFDADSAFHLEETENEEITPLNQLTNLGKVVGTIAYMAPERAIGEHANFQTDIYSLGVVLYQLLTLRHPFQRASLKEFRQNMHLEKLYDPVDVAPYRDIPRSLSRVVLKCLAVTPEQRYQSVDDLVRDIENYLEGRSEWFQMGELSIGNKSDWEFQENVLIAEHMAITRETEISDWVSLMISKTSFQENIKIEALVKIGEHGHGLGLLLSIPEASERQHLNDGYCLWIGTDNHKSTKLLRSTVEVMHASDVFLKRHQWHQVRIEKIDTNIHFYLDDVLQFSYISHLPLTGTHIGLLSRDADFMLKDFFVYVGSQNVTVNCLAVPDAFLAHKDYTTALSEYRRIGYSFPGRAEGREAMFRAGITLLEQANTMPDPLKKQELYDLAQEEFNKLHNTPGAPLEYLGKALVYQALGEFEEEAKCFELAFRRYPKHPLLPVLHEQVVYRMHSSSRQNRLATFYFILLTLRFLLNTAKNQNTQKLLNSLNKHWEPLFFIEEPPHDQESKQLVRMTFALKLAFWLAKPYVLLEIIEELAKIDPLPTIALGNAFFCLLELGEWKLAQESLDTMYNKGDLEKLMPFTPYKEHLAAAISCHASSFQKATNSFLKLCSPPISSMDERTLTYLVEEALDEKQTSIVYFLFNEFQTQDLSPKTLLRFDCNNIWAHLLDKNWQKAGELLHKYPIEQLSQENTLLHFLYGCWLYVTEGKEIALIHFAGVFEVPYPRTWTLFSYYLKGKITENHGLLSKLFPWEKKQLYRQLSLFYHCISDDGQSLHYSQLAQSATNPAQQED
jgi:serine/threonine-protein kinase